MALAPALAEYFADSTGSATVYKVQLREFVCLSAAEGWRWGLCGLTSCSLDCGALRIGRLLGFV